MGRDRAAYMREYRSRGTKISTLPSAEDVNERLLTYIAQLETEVARLKRELASRSIAGPTFNSRPFTPAPKKGK